MNRQVAGPHRTIETSDARELFAATMFDTLWERYRQRVVHVASYEKVIADQGGTFVNDHIALRTFASQTPASGIASLARIFEALGYCAAGCYNFTSKHLNAIHFQHPNRSLPKVFISELRTWELTSTAREIINRTLKSQRDWIAEERLVELANLANEQSEWSDSLLAAVVEQFHELPWSPPEKNDVETINEESQYAAWVLVHGNNVNHFTSLINSHRVESIDDIEKTIAALTAANVPMKADIEGEAGSKLRQSATAAAVIDVPVVDQGQPTTMPWTYAYFELAERRNITDPETGEETLFEGFLGPQATHLFEMTKKS